MKLNTAFDTALAENPDGRIDLIQFIGRYRSERIPVTNYRCYGAVASAVIGSFLNAAGLANTYSVEPSALDPEMRTFRWTDPSAVKVLVSDISGSLTDRVGTALAESGIPCEYSVSGNPLRDTEAYVSAPVDPNAPREEPVDLVAALESLKLDIDAHRDWFSFTGDDPCAGLGVSHYSTLGIGLAHAERALLKERAKEDHMFSSIWSNFTAVRYMSKNDDLVPAPGFFEAPCERTVFSGDGETDVMTGFLAYSISDDREARKTGGPCVALFLGATIVPKVSALSKASDREWMVNHLREMYENVYGCDGKYRVVVDPRTCITVDNQVVNRQSSVLNGKAFQWDDGGDATHWNESPVRIRAIVYVVPSGLVSDGNPHRVASVDTAREPYVKVFGSNREAFSESEFSRTYVEAKDLPAEWFCMTHTEPLPTGGNGYYANQLDKNKCTVEEKNRFYAVSANPKTSVALCRTSSKHFNLTGRDSSHGAGVPTGAPQAAFVAAVGGVLRSAWCENTGECTDRTSVWKGAEKGGLHDPDSLVTAVYSGVTSGMSANVDAWTPSEGCGFPVIRRGGLDSAAWTRFITDLPSTGAMFAVPQDGGWYNYHAIAETNISYDEFMAAATGEGASVPLARVGKRIAYAAIANLAFRNVNPLECLNADAGRNVSCDIGYWLDNSLNKESRSSITVSSIVGSPHSGCEKTGSWTVSVDESGTGDVDVLFRRDVHNRLYVVVSLNGPKAYYGHMVFRTRRGMNIRSAKTAFHAASSADLIGAVVVEPGKDSDKNCVRAYATEMLRSAVGDYSGSGPKWHSAYWKLAYGYRFCHSRHVSATVDDPPSRAWYDEVYNCTHKINLRDLLG